METTLLISIIVLNIVLLGILAFFAFLIYKLIKDRSIANTTEAENTPTPIAKITTKLHPDIKKRIDELEFTNPVPEDLFCPYHPQEPGEVQCGMCARYFCSKCVRPMKSIYFCKEHMALYLRSQWLEVLTLKSSSDDPEAGVRLFEKKNEAYLQKQIATYVETHYKIDVDSDFIETYLVLFAQESQQEEVKNLITFK